MLIHLHLHSSLRTCFSLVLGLLCTFLVGGLEAQITFSGAPADESELCQYVPPVVTVTATSTCPGAVSVSMSEDRENEVCTHTYVLVRRWTAQDACGATATHTQRITITDSQAPIIAGVPGNQTVPLGSVPAPPMPRAIDFCDANATLSVVRDSVPGPCGGYTLTYAYTAEDACGNEANRTYVLTVLGSGGTATLSPIPAGGRLACGAPLPNAPTITGQLDGSAVTPTFVQDTLTSLGGDTCMVIRRTWTITAGCAPVSGEQRFSFHDGNAPSLSGVPADVTIYCEALPPLPVIGVDIQAADNCDAQPGITFTETSTQTSNGTCTDVNYVVTRTWTAVDECGNQTSQSQELAVKCECCFNGIDDDDDGLVDDYDPQCNCFSGAEAACDSTKMYYIPPVWHPSEGRYNQPSELVITTLADVANIHIQTGDGTTFNQTFVVNKGTPLRIPLTVDQLQTPNHDRIENDRGWVITSDQLIQPIYRIDAFFNKVMVTVKGPQALGRVFRAGSQTNVCGNNNMGNGEGHFISVMATEDNTQVTLDYDFPALNGLAGPVTRTLNRFETYLIRDDRNNTTVSGSLITSTKPIVVTSGSQHSRACRYPISGDRATQGLDGGIDQLVPNCLTGDEYVLVRGKRNQVQQYAIFVANKNNTQVIVDGDASNPIVLDAGEHRQYSLLGGDYQPRHFKANKPFYMFHVSGISGNNEVGMAIAAPIGECKGDTLIEFPRFEGNSGGRLVDNTVYTIMANADLPGLQINGQPYTTCATAVPVPSRPDLSVVTFENGCLEENNRINASGYFTAGMLVGITGNTGTHGYLTAFKDRMNVYRPGSDIITTGYLIDTLCGNQTVSHCVDVSSCAVDHTIAAIRGNNGSINLTGNTCFEYTSPTDFQGEDELFVTLQNDQGLFQTVCLRYYICAEPPTLDFPFVDTLVTCEGVPPVVPPGMSDECDMEVEFTSEEVRDDGGCDYAYILYRNWTVWDDCGDSTLATQTIRVVDTSAPLALNIPNDTVVAFCGGLPPIPTPQFEENCDNDYDWSFSQRTEDSTCLYNRTIIRRWEAWDGCGNNSVSEQRIEIRDTVPPTLVGDTTDITVDCAGDIGVPLLTASDDCDSNPSVVLDSIVLPLSCDTIHHVIRRWTATDACGLSTVATQRVLVLNLAPPVFGGIPGPLDLTCGQPLPTTAPTITDDCFPAATVTQRDSIAPGVCPVTEEVYRLWTATDACGRSSTASQLVRYIDNTAPVFIPLPDTVFASCTDSVIMQEPTVVEACSYTLTFTDSIIVAATCTSERFIYRTYVATDACGQRTEYNQLYYFQDAVPPVWTFQPSDVTLACSDAIPAPLDPTVVDACSGLNPIGLTVRDSVEVCPAMRWIFREYLVSDWCGNLSTHRQTITIVGCEPAIPALATAQATCIGENITLNAGVDSGYTTPVYLWQQTIDGITWTDIGQPVDSTSYTIFNASAARNGSYRVVVANSLAELNDPDCSSISPEIEVTVRDGATSTEDISICRGDTLLYLGDTLTTSTVRVDSLLTSFGCDSIATLNLTVFPFVDIRLDTTLCFGESLTFFGQTYTRSGQYRDTMITASGCDSTLLLELTLLPNYPDTSTAFLCTGEVYTFEGVDYSTAGTYTHPLVSSTGCDSSRTLVLTAAEAKDTSISPIICAGDVYVVGGSILSASTVRTFDFVSAEGCDSTVTVNLTVIDAGPTLDTALLCEGGEYWFGGRRLNAPGDYTHTFDDQYGCDSTVNLTLVSSPVYEVERRAELCTGEVYTAGGYTITRAGRWRLDFYTAAGCDSTEYVTVIVRPTFRDTLDAIICEGDSYPLFDTTYTQAGVYTRSGLSMFGCDSTVVLRLSAKPLPTTYLDTTLCFGESFEAGGQLYSQTTRDTLVLSGALGCDSTVFLDLTIRPNPSTDTTAIVCEGEAFFTTFGSFTETGVYRDTLVSQNGCDSIRTLVLTMIPTRYDTLAFELCAGDSIEVAGQWLSSLGSHDLSLQAVSSCDSLVHVEITQRDTFFAEHQVVVCAGEPYSQAGQTWTTPGTYQLDLSTVYGCDSTILLTLQHQEPVLQSRDTLLCYGDQFSYGGQQVVEAGTYIDTLQTTVGCDSMLALNVTYLEEILTSEIVEICFGESFTANGRTLTQTGVYRDTLTTLLGCDSIRVTELVVNEHQETTLSETICFDSYYVFGADTLTAAGIYEEVFTTSAGCDSTVTLELALDGPYVLALDDLRMCAGAEGVLNLRGYAGEVRWSPTKGLSCTDCPNPTVNIGETTVYTAEVIDCRGESITASATVTIDEPVDVSIVSAEKIRLGERTTLVAVADNPSARVAWREGTQLLCDGCTEVEVAPLVTTTYEVEARTAAGCDDVARLTLVVEDACSFGEVLVPNIVTPNGDGRNDELEIRYEGISEIVLLRIYGRWGELIYETRNIDVYWDGTHHGVPVNPGVFVYYLEGYCLNGEVFTEQGNVTVVR